ncbi:hypothetical protein DFQ28_001797 [Apophysomyces sp. BC1034]|nr:hypothetical protein DFQ29_010186 [Apophysomyces sp. BC1021]KAG0190590.1 hypothetical protein DFQ28_001797 [Apophysomyces sp. BC1034]
MKTTFALALVALFASVVSAAPGGGYGFGEQGVSGTGNEGGNNGGLLNGLLENGIANDNGRSTTVVQSSKSGHHGGEYSHDEGYGREEDEWS